MINAEKFKKIFGLYVTELWAKPESEFLVWANDDYIEEKSSLNYEDFHCLMCGHEHRRPRWNKERDYYCWPSECPYCSAKMK